MAGTQRTGSDHLAAGSLATAAPAAYVGHILRRYYTVWGVYSLANGFLFAVYPLFLRARGLNQIRDEQRAGDLFRGHLPDRRADRRICRRARPPPFLRARLHDQVTAFMLYFFAHAYPVFLVAEAIDGVGTTFCNGAIDAWGVDALDDAGFAGVKDRLFSRISQLMNIGFMVSALIGTYVADINIAWPWLMSATGYGISAMVGAALMRERPGRRVHVEFAKIPRAGGRSRREGLSPRLSQPHHPDAQSGQRNLFRRVGAVLARMAAVRQRQLGLGIWVVGWVYCLLTIGRLAGAEMVMRMRGEVDACDPPDHADRGGERAFFAAGAAARRPNVVVALVLPDERADRRDDAADAELVQRADRAGDRATLLSFNSTFATMARRPDCYRWALCRRRGNSGDLEGLRGDLPRRDPVLLADLPGATAPAADIIPLLPRIIRDLVQCGVYNDVAGAIFVIEARGLAVGRRVG